MPERRRSHRPSRRRRQKRVQKAVILVASVLLGVLVLSVVWVTVRGLMAREQLVGAIPTALSIRDSVLSDDPDGLKDEIHALQTRAAAAESLTSDPVWRVVELLPLFGDNLRVVRQGAAVTNELAQEALPPLSELASSVTVASFTPTNGSFNLAAFEGVAPAVGEVRDAVTLAADHAAEIDPSTALPPIADAINDLIDMVDETKTIVDGLDAAVTLLPGMLGEDGPRRYLLMSLNSAELRSSGGIPGALSVITADQGAITIGESASAAELGRFDPPALPQTDTELALFQGLTGAFMQDVNLTPDFARAAETAQAMWLARKGTPVDGVISLDPIALSYILEATGPVDVGSGIIIDSTSAAPVLLSGAYQMFADPTAQDAFFAEVTKRVFAALTTGPVDSAALLEGLARAAAQDRIHVWSSSPVEQRAIVNFDIAGVLPTSTDSVSAFGIYLNDRTESKMSFYLAARAGAGVMLCRADGRPTYGVSLTLTSSAPADAATSLPRYVTGNGVPGRERGVIATNVFVYAPSDFLAYSVRIDGEEQGFMAVDDAGRSVVGIDVVLDPGETAQLDVLFLGDPSSPRELSISTTPMVSSFPVETGVEFDCPPEKAPGTETDVEALGHTTLTGGTGFEILPQRNLRSLPPRLGVPYSGA